MVPASSGASLLGSVSKRGSVWASTPVPVAAKAASMDNCLSMERRFMLISDVGST